MKKVAVFAMFAAMFTVAVAGTALTLDTTPTAAMEGPGPYIISK
ncbi:hypothetical protein OS242_13765 [Tumebacillus sp. DT12]|uniref:Phosphatase n=1 Tax=Tumebacillus lacus TaxID=2995335 RepID=A0ABT3X588_9BACL|nr:hypothetical protein [Tumebacillus lacus]MCX7571012.1 hypothetical protein [Tumebacillus lacus]